MRRNKDRIIIQRLKTLVKDALRCGKIYHYNRIKVCIGYNFGNVRKLNNEEWSEFEDHERYFRKGVAGKQINVGEYICKGDFQKWFNISKCLSGIFFKNNIFLEKNHRGEEWSILLLKFCKRILNKFPLDKQLVNIDNDLLNTIRVSINYVNGTIIPFFKKKEFNEHDEIVSKEKLTELWINKRKKAINIIKNDGKWPIPINVEVSVEANENYYSSLAKYVKSSEINDIDGRYFIKNDDYLNDIPLFNSNEICKVVMTSPNGRSCGSDGVSYEDIKSHWADKSESITGIFNIITVNMKWPSTWKHAVINRSPKKNFDINDLTTLRDISLLPVLYKIFSKCLCTRILPFINNKIAFWQRAYLASRDRQDLIFALKTAIDDLKHMSAKLHLVFIDFSDAFGSVNHIFMFETLRQFEIPLLYCVLIEDLYRYSQFQVICGQELTDTFSIIRGTKTGDPLSALLFIAVIDRIFKPMVTSAMLDLNIRDQRRLNPIPVKGYADDICIASLYKEVVDNMLKAGEPIMIQAELDIKISKCSVLYGRRSGNNWYKGKADSTPKFLIQNKIIPNNNRNEAYTYLGKSVSIEGEDMNQIKEFCDIYKANVDKICTCILPLSLKCSALNNMALAKILHHFSNTRLKQTLLKSLDDFLTKKVRDMFGLYTTTTKLIIYLPRIHGGLGIKKLSHVYYITRISFLVKMLNHNEEIFSNIAKNALQRDMEKRGVSESQENNNFLGYEVKENGYLATTTKFGCDSDWHDLAVYARKLGILIQWFDGKAMVIINGEKYSDHIKIRDTLKSIILKNQLDKAKTLSMQGNFFIIDKIDRKNSHTIYYNWKVSDDLIKFAAKARLNILPTNFTLYIWDREKDPKCSLCLHPTESMAHLLNSCKKFKSFRTRRHDRIVSKITQFIRNNSTFDTHENKMAFTVFPQFREILQNLDHGKPDIICINNNTVIVVEITICYDLYMIDAFEEKERRYTPLITLLHEKGYSAKLIIMCFGSLGTIEKSIYNSLLIFNRDKTLVKDVIKWCSISVLIAANYIWRYRVKYTTEGL